MFLPGTKQSNNNIVAVQYTTDIELRIGAAPAINLGKQQGKIQAGNLLLNNTNQQLSLLNSAGEAGIATLTVPNGKDT